MQKPTKIRLKGHSKDYVINYSRPVPKERVFHGLVAKRQSALFHLDQFDNERGVKLYKNQRAHAKQMRELKKRVAAIDFLIESYEVELI